METTVQSLLADRFSAYAQQHRQPLHKHKAAHAAIQCRTAALGGHVQSCPDGHTTKICYNSCKHRSCPQCSALPTERWLQAQKAKLLDCDHYHVIFTLPHQLLDLWWHNNRMMTDLLFSTAIATLRELMADEKYLGAQVGIIASLHTWGRNLSRHPHLHCLVTGGGRDPNGEWSAVQNGYLLPFQVVRALFRGKFIAGLRQRYQQGELTLPPELDRHAFNRLLNRLSRKIKWNVHLQERYAHGRGVVTYLARYVKGGPLNNRQLTQTADGHVHFRYTDHRNQQTQSLSLTPEQFITRWLWHIPEHRQHNIRHYGLYHPRNLAKRAHCRAALGQPPEPETTFLDWQTYWQRLGKPDQSRCPVCHQLFQATSILPRSHSPPQITITRDAA